jgi:hypothetical protein
VEPEDRRLPVAQVNPDPSKVASVPAAADAAELAPDLADEAADPAADVAAAAADDVVAVLLSLPQALSVNAPTASRAISPLIRVIFTLFLHRVSQLLTNASPVWGKGDHWPPTWDRRRRGWTESSLRVNGR